MVLSAAHPPPGIPPASSALIGEGPATSETKALARPAEAASVGAIADKSVLVLGAGMVGVCVALELQRRGAKVTLIDRGDPGQMSAGLCASSLERCPVPSGRRPKRSIG